MEDRVMTDTDKPWAVAITRARPLRTAKVGREGMDTRR